MPVFERACVVLVPNDHGAILLTKLINAYQELTTLGDTDPPNDFDQVFGCGERIGVCPYLRPVKADVGAERYRINGIVALFRFYGAFGILTQLLPLQRQKVVPQPSAPFPHK